MSRSSPSTRRPKARPRARTLPAPPATSPLAERFAHFRGHHPPGARVPQDLREAVLAALQQGLAPGELYRSCGLSWGQVAAWKANQREMSPATAAAAVTQEPAGVRVFSVTDDPQRGVPELELRFGPWSVCVRLAEPVPARRG